MEIIRNNYIDDPSKEKAEVLTFTRENMIRAIGARWKTTIQDFTQTNQNGIFRHRYSVSFVVENDKGEMVAKRRQVTYLHATIPGKDYPRKPRVAEVFKDEDEMDDCTCGIKKRKRNKDQVDQFFCLQPATLPLIFLILATGIADLPQNYLFRWLESP
jgi:hypothetical protein